MAFGSRTLNSQGAETWDGEGNRSSPRLAHRLVQVQLGASHGLRSRIRADHPSVGHIDVDRRGGLRVVVDREISRAAHTLRGWRAPTDSRRPGDSGRPRRT